MNPIPIQVQCYSGHKADERPLRFVCEGIEIEVEEILDQWLAASKESGQPASDYFKVLGNDGHNYLLRHEKASDRWFVVNRWRSFGRINPVRCLAGRASFSGVSSRGPRDDKTRPSHASLSFCGE